MSLYKLHYINLANALIQSDLLLIQLNRSKIWHCFLHGSVGWSTSLVLADHQSFIHHSIIILLLRSYHNIILTFLLRSRPVHGVLHNIKTNNFHYGCLLIFSVGNLLNQVLLIFITHYTHYFLFELPQQCL